MYLDATLLRPRRKLEWQLGLSTETIIPLLGVEAICGVGDAVDFVMNQEPLRTIPGGARRGQVANLILLLSESTGRERGHG